MGQQAKPRIASISAAAILALTLVCAPRAEAHAADGQNARGTIELAQNTRHDRSARQRRARKPREVFGPPMTAHSAAPQGSEVGPRLVGAPPKITPPATSASVVPTPETAGDECRTKLGAMGAVFQPATMPAASSPACTIADPVRLEQIKVTRKGAIESVKLSAPPLIACEAALAVTDWVQDSVAPLTHGHFDEPLVELGVGGGFECRQRNHQPNAPRSEHAYGRALDVMSFRTPTRTIKVEKSPPEASKSFLDAVWASGCGRFSTALGPDADAFHETHIHVDLQPRRSKSSKFCE